jgi:glycosyltransferase involved in cell wall biosynthesis
VPDITVCIPTIPPRRNLLENALRSVRAQTLQPAEVIVETDIGKTGAAATRNRALDRVKTPLVAFLDDDDELYRFHLEYLRDELVSSGADLVYPWFEIIGNSDPLGWFGKPFDPDALRQANYIPVTVLARTEAVRDAGGFRNLRDSGSTCEDWVCWLKMLDNGCKFVHLPEKTWEWVHWYGNSGGSPNW